MKKVILSVIIPTYNGSLYISETIDSILNQTFTNFEIIIIDDGSTDNTVEIIKRYDDPRIRLIHSENSGGPAKPRNLGIEASKGDYIAFCDDDDLWDSEKLKNTLSFLDSYDLIYHDCNYIYDKRPLIAPKRSFSRDLNKKNPFEDLISNGNTLINSSVVCNKTILQKINGLDEEESISSFEDYDLWLRISLITNKIKYIPKIHGTYRILRSSISRKGGQRIRCINYLVKKYQINPIPDWMIYHSLVAANSINDEVLARKYYKELFDRSRYKLVIKAFLKKIFQNRI